MSSVTRNYLRVQSYHASAAGMATVQRDVVVTAHARHVTRRSMRKSGQTRRVLCCGRQRDGMCESHMQPHTFHQGIVDLVIDEILVLVLVPRSDVEASELRESAATYSLYE